jgi:hypothetical protein
LVDGGELHDWIMAQHGMCYNLSLWNFKIEHNKCYIHFSFNVRVLPDAQPDNSVITYYHFLCINIDELKIELVILIMICQSGGTVFCFLIVAFIYNTLSLYFLQLWRLWL